VICRCVILSTTAFSQDRNPRASSHRAPSWLRPMLAAGDRPLPLMRATFCREVVVGYKLLEVTTTVTEPRGVQGIPEGTPTDRSTYREVAPTPVDPGFQPLDRPRENFFNPILPQLQLFNSF
jgi:hypothetical protein